jgi:hypothetical protein
LSGVLEHPHAFERQGCSDFFGKLLVVGEDGVHHVSGLPDTYRRMIMASSGLRLLAAAEPAA